MSTDFETAFSSAMEAAGSDSGGDSDVLTEVHYGDDLPDVSDSLSDDEDVDVDDIDVDADEVDDDVSLSDDEFDLSSVVDKKVTVKVAGQPVTVTVREMADGYMRQADYTRKTQELKGYVAWAQEVQTALNTDPQGTIRQMAEYFGVPLGEVAEPVDPFADMDPDLVPLAKQNQALAAEIQRMKAEFDRQAQDRVLNEVRAEMEAVKAKYPDFDPQEVLPVAAEKGLSIQEAYELVSYRKYQASRSAEEAAKAKAAAKAEAVAQKKAAAKRVSPGSSLKGSATPPEFADFGELLEFNMRNS